MYTIPLKKEIRSILKRDMVLTISLMLALVSSLFFKPRISYIDFSVLGMLLSFMLVVAGFRQLRVLEKAAVLLQGDAGVLFNQIRASGALPRRS